MKHPVHSLGLGDSALLVVFEHRPVVFNRYGSVCHWHRLRQAATDSGGPVCVGSELVDCLMHRLTDAQRNSGPETELTISPWRLSLTVWKYVLIKHCTYYVEVHWAAFTWRWGVLKYPVGLLDRTAENLLVPTPHSHEETQWDCPAQETHTHTSYIYMFCEKYIFSSQYIGWHSYTKVLQDDNYNTVVVRKNTYKTNRHG